MIGHACECAFRKLGRRRDLLLLRILMDVPSVTASRTHCCMAYIVPTSYMVYLQLIWQDHKPLVAKTSHWSSKAVTKLMEGQEGVDAVLAMQTKLQLRSKLNSVYAHAIVQYYRADMHALQ